MNIDEAVAHQLRNGGGVAGVGQAENLAQLPGQQDPAAHQLRGEVGHAQNPAQLLQRDPAAHHLRGEAGVLGHAGNPAQLPDRQVNVPPGQLIQQARVPLYQHGNQNAVPRQFFQANMPLQHLVVLIIKGFFK